MSLKVERKINSHSYVSFCMMSGRANNSESILQIEVKNVKILNQSNTFCEVLNVSQTIM